MGVVWRTMLGRFEGGFSGKIGMLIVGIERMLGL